MTLEARKSEKSCGGWNETPDNSTVRCSLLADLVKSLYEQIDILKSEVYFLQEELRVKRNLLKIIVTSEIPRTCWWICPRKETAKVFDNNERERMLYYRYWWQYQHQKLYF